MLDATCYGLKILRGKSFPNPESWKNWEWEGNEAHYVELRMPGRSQQRRDPGSGLQKGTLHSSGHSSTRALDLGVGAAQ